MSDRPSLPPSNGVQIWMPLYIGDYLADTISLNNAQHGAYLRSMMAYWRKGEALSNEELTDICGKEFDRIAKFYIPADDRWHHKRIDIELAKARDRSRKMKEISKKGVAARLLKKQPHG